WPQAWHWSWRRAARSRDAHLWGPQAATPAPAEKARAPAAAPSPAAAAAREPTLDPGPAGARGRGGPPGGPPSSAAPTEAVGPDPAPPGSYRVINGGLAYPRTSVCNTTYCLTGGISP